MAVDLYKRLKSGTNVISDEEYLQTFIQVSHIASEYLGKTLGPYAHTTVIDDGQFRYSTKDGWSIANRLSFSDPLANTLFNFIKSISYSLVSKVGDGTTTAIVAADQFIHIMNSATEYKRYRQRDVIAALEEIKDAIIDELNTSSIVHHIDPKGDFEEIRRIAYTSTNGNDQVADSIQKIYQVTGNPNIYVDLGSDTKTTTDIEIGYRFECMPKMVNLYRNSDSGEFIPGQGDTIGYVFNSNVTFREYHYFVEEISQYADKLSLMRHHPVTAILIAPYFDDVMSASINNFITSDLNQHRFPSIMMIQYPMANNRQRAFINDFMSILQAHPVDGAVIEAFNRLRDPELFTEESQDNFKRSTASSLGAYKTVDEIVENYAIALENLTINPKFILLTKYDTESLSYKNAYAEIKKEYDEAAEIAAHNMNVLDHSYIDASMRYIRFIGKMGTIRVGGESELEKKCLKDSIDDAVLAARSAFENGYVKGMNLATIYAISKVTAKTKALPETDSRRTMRLQILKTLDNAFRQTTLRVVTNKYPNAKIDSEVFKNDKVIAALPQDISGKALSLNKIIGICNTYNVGYNLVTEQFEDNNHLTVINSISTDVEILKSMISILGYVLTSNQMLGLSIGYDKEIGRQINADQEYEKYKNIAKAVADALIPEGGLGIPIQRF